jgi:hypothetical protein
MNAPTRPEPKPVKHPAKPTGETLDARAAVERTMKRYPKTMARLAE